MLGTMSPKAFIVLVIWLFGSARSMELNAELTLTKSTANTETLEDLEELHKKMADPSISVKERDQHKKDWEKIIEALKMKIDELERLPNVKEVHLEIRNSASDKLLSYKLGGMGRFQHYPLASKTKRKHSLKKRKGDQVVAKVYFYLIGSEQDMYRKIVEGRGKHRPIYMNLRRLEAWKIKLMRRTENFGEEDKFGEEKTADILARITELLDEVGKKRWLTEDPTIEQDLTKLVNHLDNVEIAEQATGGTLGMTRHEFPNCE